MARVQKKRSPGRPAGTQYRETIPVRLTVEAAAAVDAWARRQNERGISRSEAIRRLVDQALTGGQKLDAGTARDFGDAIVAAERAVTALRRVIKRGV